MKFIRALLPLALGACAGPEIEPVVTTEPQPLEMPAARMADHRHPRPFVRVQQALSEHARQRVTLHLQDATLSECLTRADPALNLVPDDPGIDLERRYDVRVNDLTLWQYLHILEGLSGYALELAADSPLVHVASYQTRSWDVSTFAGQGQSRLQVGQSVTLSSSSHSSGGTAQESGPQAEQAESSPATVIYDHMDEPWKDLLRNARSILGLPTGDAVPELGSRPAAAADASPAPVPTKTWLVADRRLGLLRARGPVPRMQELDAWLTEQTRRGARQILLTVAILDVTRSQNASGGLNMNIIYDRLNTLDQRYGSTRDVGRGILSLNTPNGAWELDAALEFGRWSVETLVQQLAQQGQVTVRSDPVFTVVNGMTTFLGDGEEVSFIASTDLSVGSGTDAKPLLSTKFEHIRVGFRIAVTPRMRHDGSILVEVVPVLSSIRSQSTFQTGVSTIVRPNIAVQEMATLAITRSGKPILLGGLIQSRAKDDSYRPPCDHPLCDAFAASSLERSNRELMIVITPIEVAI